MNASIGKLEKKDTELLTQTLTAFANSDGGLLLVGIDCRPNPTDKTDEACGILPVTGIRKFAADVKANILNFAKPNLEDVTVERIERQPDLSQGPDKEKAPIYGAFSFPEMVGAPGLEPGTR